MQGLRRQARNTVGRSVVATCLGGLLVDDCRQRQVPCGYRDAQEAASSVPAHGSLVQSALRSRRSIRYCARTCQTIIAS